jgi:diguanylate cyclase (GGDEF)-like protein/PAS domain S-box-containing protein
VVILGEVFPARSTLPAWFASIFRVTSLAAAVATVMLLLWQFSSRLTETLAQTRAAEERYALAVHGANDGLWDWDLKANQIYFSPRWKAMLGYAEHEIAPTLDEWFARIHPDDRVRVRTEIAAHLAERTPYFESEHRMAHRDGHYLWMLSRGLAVRDGDGQATRMAGSQTDISGRKQVEEQLLHDALHDALTGLPNRALFMDRLGRAVERAKRQAEYCYAVLFMDFDRFKVVNDSLGHTVGDDLLIGIARRLEGCLRPTDTVARLGGDEFVILLDGIRDVEDATRVADRIQKELAVPFPLNGQEVFTTVSIGIALSTPGYDRPEDLLRDADTVMYRAKALGRARHEVFDQVLHADAVALLQLETDLRRAVERREFLVYYQPIVSLKTGRMAGFEALVRWQHPQRGLILPEEFITVAAETGLMVPIGWLVLRDACRQMSIWQARFSTKAPMTISVNFMGNQFGQPRLVEQIKCVLQETGLDARRLRLEITEREITENAEAAALMLSRLRALDIQLHIDDFGTGYSSLSMLHRFPIDALKIDRSFVTRMGTDDESAEIVQTIVTLAHNLGMDVIAEGVETAAQLGYLRTCGCDYGQGYLFSKAVDAAHAETLITAEPQW